MLDWLICTLVSALGAILCRLPPSVAVWLGEQGGTIASWAQPKRTRIGLANLRAAFEGRLSPAQARQIIRRCYRQLGAGIMELLRLPAIDRAYAERYVTIVGREHIEAAVASRRPVIFLAGHYGNWELPSIVAALYGHPLVALARAQNKLPRLYNLLVSYRESKGCTIVHKGGAMRQLLAALERRQPVGIVGDQASRQGIFVDFFGRPALFATGPFQLAYAKDALILPTFAHRVRGPFHRIVIEPPVTLSRALPKEAAVAAGIERFAQMLARHITEEPWQWLWMHKRWKHTPARRALVLSDGKLGHVKQSLAVIEALRERHPTLTHHVVEIRYRPGWGRAIALLWSGLLPSGLGAGWCLQRVLTPDSAHALLSRYADVVVSCGTSLLPANLLSAAEHRAKSVVIMRPAPFPSSRFDVVIAPRHDGLPERPNVVQTAGALVARLHEEELVQARDQLRTHPKYRSGDHLERRHPVVAVFIGGETAHYTLSRAFVSALLEQVQAACDATDGWYLVTTSRRTSGEAEQAAAQRTGDPRCRLVVLASRDLLDGTMVGMLGSANVAVVTGESISMVSEACASGRHVLVVEPPLRGPGSARPTKHQRFLHGLTAKGYARVIPLPALGRAIQEALARPEPIQRLDDVVAVREALARLL